MVAPVHFSISAIIPQKPSYSDPTFQNSFELGYVFGFLDFAKTRVWGVNDFNRSFFHAGFSIYLFFEPEKSHKDKILRIESGCEAIFNAFVHLQSRDEDFLEGVTSGKMDALGWFKDQIPPMSLSKYFHRLAMDE